MTWYCAALSALVAPLLIAGHAHLADTASFARVIRSHGLFTGRVVPALARAVALLETGGAIGLLALLIVDPGASRPMVIALAALFAVFAGYLVIVHRRSAGAGSLECGCGLGTPLHRWSWSRPAALAGGLLLALALSWPPAALAERSLAVAAGWSLTTAALCLWQMRRMNERAMAYARQAYRLLGGE
ncbi:MauE/DoxX family redox-associated membrane protein [Nonomuraea zeae]|uniref:Methylamine utilisation protein MauE domain-containing protein n=1 Tax=Nonomuraea zeae TaxID=1642303 RepID=A0A5S4HE91_9ACTN|nr:MauE/DoxX family redox-associated membrane protein [Nonomuraea zeae]TMR37210.1 hypothetical protein ETD85_08785 [Nonomuraea zeae]